MTEIKLPQIFADYMVLQQKKPVKIWGECGEEKELLVAIEDQQVRTRAKDGKFTAVLEPLSAGTEKTLRIFVEGEEMPAVTVSHIAVGEVWIAGGQSNMQFRLEYDREADQVIPHSFNEDIRMFDVPKLSYEGQEKDEDTSQYGFWRTLTPENAPAFSAPGYYFALKLYENLGVPVGIVGCNYGGTKASAWMNRKYLEGDPELSVYLEEYEKEKDQLDLAAYDEKWLAARREFLSPEGRERDRAVMKGTFTHQDYLREVEAGNMEPKTPEAKGPKWPSRPSGLYEQMLKRIIPYTVRGVLWYQGESDNDKPELYGKLYEALIRCWREEWQERLPFLTVLLAPFQEWFNCTGKNFEQIRRQQLYIAEGLDQVYCTNVMDAGEQYDIHPKRKRPVGERLALLALQKIYNKNVQGEAPFLEGIECEMDGFHMTFSGCPGGLKIEGDTLNGLEIYVDGHKAEGWHAQVNGEDVEIRNLFLRKGSMIDIKFAYQPYVNVNLYNMAGIPAMPFYKKMMK